MMSIPVYHVKVPEYKLKKLNEKSGKIRYALTPSYSIRIPEVYEKNKPDFAKIGSKIDKCLKKHFLDKKVAVRALGSEEHKGKSADEVIRIIKKIGHDRYNPKISGDRYENVENKKIDFFALDFKIKPNGEYFKQFIEPFYYWPIKDRGKPVRIDIAVVYDLSKLKRVVHRYEGRTGMKRDGFVFKNSNSKREALLGIIKIL